MATAVAVVEGHGRSRDISGAHASPFVAVAAAAVGAMAAATAFADASATAVVCCQSWRCGRGGDDCGVQRQCGRARVSRGARCCWTSVWQCPWSATTASCGGPTAVRRWDFLPRDRTRLRAARKSAIGGGVGQKNQKRCLCKFGVIGDIQYADIDDGADFFGIHRRYYRQTLDIVRSAVKRWVLEEHVDFAVQLGDAVDGRNVGGQSHEALDAVLREFPQRLPRVDLVGNHELYNFGRAGLAATRLHLLGQGLPGAEPGLAISERGAGEACYFHFFADGEASAHWEFICLDAYDVASIGYEAAHPRRIEALQLFSRNNARALMEGVDWFHNVRDEKQRFVPLNGGIGVAQLEWLQGRLQACTEAGRRAIVFTHIPILEASTTPKTVLFNAEEVLQVLRSEEGRCVVAVIAGHDHDAGYAVDLASGIHHVTFLSPLICPPGSGYTGAATVTCYQDRAEIVGHGIFCVESGTQARGLPLARIPLERLDPRGW